MQFQPPSQPGWDQSEPDPFNSRVQQLYLPQQPYYPPQQPGQYFQQQTQYPPFPPQQPVYPPGQHYWQQLPVTPLLPQKAPKKPINKKLGIGCGVAVVVLVVIIAIAVAAQGSTNSSTAINSTTPAVETSSTQPTSAPTQPPHYPPTTQADLRGLAAQGDASAIHPFHQESVGLTGGCPQPKVEATVDQSLTGKQLAEDLLAYFYDQQLDSPCGSIVFVYRTQSEANGDGYTAGRILFDVTDSSGSENTDPNATNLKYTLTLDVGSFDSGQEYVVTY